MNFVRFSRTLITGNFARSLLLVASLAAGQAHAAVTMVWGNEIDSINVASDGSTALDSSFTAALGTFADGFVPTAGNTADWGDHWLEFGVADYAAGDGYFSGTGTLSGNETRPVGTQLFVWIRNTMTPEQGAEWFLATDDSSDGNAGDNWTVPDVSGTDQTTRPAFYTVSCSPADAMNVIFGGMSGTGSEVQAGGLYADPAGTWCLQTHALAAIPEPSAVVLGAAAAGLLFTRRKRATGKEIREKI